MGPNVPLCRRTRLGGVLGLEGAAAAAATAFGNSALLSSVDGLVSGDFDLGAILETAAFSGVTAGLTAGVQINFPEGHPFNGALIDGFGTTQFTMAGLLNSGLDGVISSGLSSAVYGTDFGDGVLSSVVSYVANGVAGAAIQEVSDALDHDTFSIEKMVAKATINCLAAEAKGASCASGAVGTLVTEVFTSGLPDQDLTLDEIDAFKAELELFAALAGFFTSGGEAANVNATVTAAQLDYDNNIVPILIAIAIAGLTVADYALTAYDAYELSQKGLACDGGDQAACDAVIEMAKQFGIETAFELTAGQLIPGSKVGMKIIAALKKHGDPKLIEAANKALDDVATKGGVPEGYREIKPVGSQVSVPNGYKKLQNDNGDVVYQDAKGITYDSIDDLPTPTGQFEGKYVSNPKHDRPGGKISSQPTNPEATMSNSVPVGGNSNKRIGYDPDTNEIVVFQYDETTNAYHGYVPTEWAKMPQQERNALIRAGLFKPNGKLK